MLVVKEGCRLVKLWGVECETREKKGRTPKGGIVVMGCVGGWLMLMDG